ncbi:MAG TPA: hypothetical protein QKA08_00960 [Candidatus Megaira endosymbiont of Nemacystus decipiens]|nr:hypothetical protein [Candidatus Megaera endosymbiont of Nemacystus decipiens]
MFNTLLSVSDLFILTLLFFIILLVFRLLFIKSKKLIFAYHIILFCVLFILSIGGGSVQNDGYRRLEKFIELENNGELSLAKSNLQDYDSMLQIDLKEFNNSNEFKDYLKRQDVDIDRAEAIFVAWLFVFLTEISILIAQLINYIIFVIKALLKRKKV